MTTKALGRRVDHLRQAGDAEPAIRFVVIMPESWPADVRAAYDAATAAGDRTRRADIVEAQTGRLPVFPRDGAMSRHRTPPIVEFRSRPDGPQ